MIHESTTPPPPDEQPEDVEARSRIERARDGAREGIDRAREVLASGAGAVAEASRTVASEAADRAGRAVEFVREAETDRDLKRNVEEGTESTLHAAADRVSGAAPTVGRGAEAAARVVGAALHKVAHPLAVVLGAIAGTLGGWWQKARENGPDFPESEDAACRAHFLSVTVHPDGMTYEEARTGYALGYIAASNPDYDGRGFDAIEPDLRVGFHGEREEEFERLREYARYGFGRRGDRM
jgi:hypothetical protein